jgi:signal recognition particle GTPase
MKVTELKKKELAREFKIIVSSKDVTDKLNGSLVQIYKDVEIEGFRKGKAPLNIVKQRFGQNALNQVEEFTKIHKITGLIITKLDSTAKGGIVLAICKKYKLPILAIGMGEKETDLYPFNAEFFAKGLFQLN